MQLLTHHRSEKHVYYVTNARKRRCSTIIFILQWVEWNGIFNKVKQSLTIVCDYTEIINY